MKEYEISRGSEDTNESSLRAGRSRACQSINSQPQPRSIYLQAHIAGTDTRKVKKNNKRARGRTREGNKSHSGKGSKQPHRGRKHPSPRHATTSDGVGTSHLTLQREERSYQRNRRAVGKKHERFLGNSRCRQHLKTERRGEVIQDREEDLARRKEALQESELFE